MYRESDSPNKTIKKLDQDIRNEAKLHQAEQKEVMKLEIKWRKLATLIKEHDKNK